MTSTASFSSFSRIRYLIDPARPDGFPIPLGVAVEVRVGKQWVVGISVRSALSRDEIEVLDGIARELLRNPFELIKNDVSALVVSATKPGDILRALASTKPWSLNVTPPEHWNLSLKSGPLQPQIKEQMSVLWAKVVQDLLRAAVPKQQRSRNPAGRATEMAVAPGRLFVQDDCWRADIVAAH